MVCQERAPKTPHCSERWVPAQNHSPAADTCEAGGRGGGVPLIPNLKRTEVLSHPRWFVDIHLWCKNLDYRPRGNNAKIHDPPSPCKQTCLECAATDFKGREARQGWWVVRWRAEATGKAWSLVVLFSIPSLKFSVVHTASAEQFSPVNAAGIHMLSHYSNRNQIRIQI